MTYEDPVLAKQVKFLETITNDLEQPIEGSTNINMMLELIKAG